jgi:hypothetical protein
MKRFVGIGVLLLALVVPAAASTFVALSHQDLVAQSDAIVQGRVLKVSSFWSPSGRIIQSEAMIQVEEKIRGNAPSVVVVRTFGGTVGGYTVEAEGFPKFAVNERVVLFLQNAGDVAEVTGYRQGQWRIVRDKSGVEMAVPTMEGSMLVSGRDGRTVAAQKALPLATFKAQIRAVADRPGTGRNSN